MANKSTLALYMLIALCAALVIGEFVIYRKAYFALEATPLFFAAYGLVCLAAALLIGAVLAKLVARPLDYYDADMHKDIQGDDNA